MTELEQAREHLRKAQDVLYISRAGGAEFALDTRVQVDRGYLQTCEATVLAALSWVWDAQERQTSQFVTDWRKGTRTYSVKAMGIDWMVRDELREAIPPAYAEYIGRAAIRAMRKAA